MDPSLGEALVRWSIRVAVACYLGRVFLDIGLWPNRARWPRYHAARGLWTIGCGCYLLHVLSAFAFFHTFSHEQAYRHTAAQTQQVTGIDWGGGLYVNYAFTLWWAADTTVWWAGDVRLPYRRRSYHLMLHAVFAFMMFNATVVFGPPEWRYAGCVVGAAIAAALLFVRVRGQGPSRR